MTPIAAAAIVALFLVPICGWFAACERLRAERAVSKCSCNRRGQK